MMMPHLRKPEKVPPEPASCSVADPWFDALRRGKKTVEGRLDRGTFSKLRRGHLLVFKNGRRKFAARVVAVRRYPGFREYLENEGLRSTLPGVRDVASGIAVYRSFYSEQDERAHGVVAIQVAPDVAIQVAPDVAIPGQRRPPTTG